MKEGRGELEMEMFSSSETVVVAVFSLVFPARWEEPTAAHSRDNENRRAWWHGGKVLPLNSLVSYVG